MRGKHLLITGGTGSFGSVFVERVLPHVGSVTVYSRDEFKQSEMAARLDSDRLRFVIGDIRDLSRLDAAMAGIDLVVHAAAMKQVPTCEANPTEAIDTNVIGSRNVIAAAGLRGCRVLALSTDKAVVPANVYGASKMLCDRLFLSAGYPVIRCGNLFGSRGSVIPIFQRQRSSGVITITDCRMTRYSILPETAVGFVIRVLMDTEGPGLYIPKMPSYRLTDVAEAVAPGCEIREIGARAGEQIHECLLTEAEAPFASDWGTYYMVGPRGDGTCAALYSDRNTDWLTVEDIRGML